MEYRLLADLVMLAHLAFILFVAFGGLLALRRPWVAWAHLPAVLWAAAIEFFGWICPLTPLENILRALAGERGYRGDFIEHYLLPIIYPQTLTRDIQFGLGLAVLAINALLYAWLLRRARRCSRH